MSLHNLQHDSSTMYVISQVTISLFQVNLNFKNVLTYMFFLRDMVSSKVNSMIMEDARKKR